MPTDRSSRRKLRLCSGANESNLPMNPTDSSLPNRPKKGTTRRISPYWKLVCMWNAKENSRRKIEINSSGCENSIPTCVLLSGSRGRVTTSVKAPKPPTRIGLRKMGLNGGIGAPEKDHQYED